MKPAIPNPGAPLKVGSVVLRNRVLLAPMSGVTDRPFRTLAYEAGAGLVVTEMVASQSLVLNRDKEMMRTERGGEGPFVIQLAGREARWMAEGAKIASDRGANIIDINMGCPARQVTRGLSGSALMRDIDHAVSLIDAVIGATDLPVTLKMRMGWCPETLNAPELARRAEVAGIQMITVHGRTRCQFFKGRADWSFVKKVKDAVCVPVIVNGDISSHADVARSLKASGADGVMVGRGAYGRPWFPGCAAEALAGSDAPRVPGPKEKRDIVVRHYESMLQHYGLEHGVRHARKHLGWYVADAATNEEDARTWRSRMCRAESPSEVRRHIEHFYGSRMQEAA